MVRIHLRGKEDKKGEYNHTVDVSFWSLIKVYLLTSIAITAMFWALMILLIFVFNVLGAFI